MLRFTEQVRPIALDVCISRDDSEQHLLRASVVDFRRCAEKGRFTMARIPFVLGARDASLMLC
jgi:hypothetical protein